MTFLCGDPLIDSVGTFEYTVQYLIDYNFINPTSSPNVIQLNGTPKLGSPKSTISLTVEENIYDPETYCDIPEKIGLSYYTLTLFAVDDTFTLFRGPYQATNRFELNGSIYTIYKSGILEQELSEPYDGNNYLTTAIPINIKIITENVIGLDVVSKETGISQTSNSVAVSNKSGECNGISYTIYTVSFRATSLDRRPLRS